MSAVPSVFSRIIAGELPGHVVWADQRAVAFLSINPLKRGHTLVVPREEVDHWLDLDADLLAHLSEVARRVGRAQQRAFDPERVGMMIAGLEVPHVHLHVVPIDGVHDLDFANAAASVPDDELASAAEAIRAELRELGEPHVADGPVA